MKRKNVHLLRINGPLSLFAYLPSPLSFKLISLFSHFSMSLSFLSLLFSLFLFYLLSIFSLASQFRDFSTCNRFQNIMINVFHSRTEASRQTFYNSFWLTSNKELKHYESFSLFRSRLQNEFLRKNSSHTFCPNDRTYILIERND